MSGDFRYLGELSKKSRSARRERRRTWEIVSSFNRERRCDQMMKPPSDKVVEKYGSSRDRLTITAEEKQEILNDIEGLKKSPKSKGKSLGKMGTHKEIKSIRSASEKVRVHFSIDEYDTCVHILEIEFRDKLYDDDGLHTRKENFIGKEMMEMIEHWI